MKKKRLRDRIQEILNSNTDNPIKKVEEKTLSKKLKDNVKIIEDIIGFSDDVEIRNFEIANKDKTKAAIIFIDGLVNSQIINDNILKPLLDFNLIEENSKESTINDFASFLERKILSVDEVEINDQLEDLVQGPLMGKTILLIDGYNKGLILNTIGLEFRGVEEPQTEAIIRGPRDGFTENLRVNTSLIRRRIKHPSLRIKNMVVGKYSKTDISICYIEGLTNKYLVEEVKERIANIEIDGIQDSGYIEQLIEDNHYSLFPQLLSSERPDRAVANLLEGRIVIVTDGTPFALIAPVTISVFLQSPEDYYDRFMIASLLRFIRFIALIITLTLPAFYIALIAYHPEMIPTELALAFAGGRAEVPFPSYIEAFLMAGLMELLREGSVRLPTPIGPTIGIVGALIIGEAAVTANIVSPFMVIIIATTTIASFAIPNYSAAIALRLLQFPLMIMASIFGLYGIILGLIIISIHLVSLKSFGIPYMTPMAPSRINDMKDTLVNVPIWSRFNRPKHLRTKNRQRFSSKGDDDGNERTR
ncbi:spore germination protein [Natronospora cellulosivora (SeqCode)]